MIEDELRRRFYTSEIVMNQLPLIQADVLDGKLSATHAVHRMMDLYDTFMKNKNGKAFS